MTCTKCRQECSNVRDTLCADCYEQHIRKIQDAEAVPCGYWRVLIWGRYHSDNATRCKLASGHDGPHKAHEEEPK